MSSADSRSWKSEASNPTSSSLPRSGLRSGFPTEFGVTPEVPSPAVTAECAAPFLVVGGHLVVSEPPGDDDEAPGGSPPSPRWPAEGLARVGLAPATAWTEPFHYRSFVLERPCPEEFPRRDGVPAKRPLF